MTFGRAADIVLDDANLYMHRICGVFDVAGDHWVLENCGASTPLSVVDVNGSRVQVAPAGTAVLNAPSGAIRFVAGPTPYELLYEVEGQTASATGSEVAHDGVGPTVNFGAYLTTKERHYLSCFARPWLKGTGTKAPSFGEVAHLWGVSERTVEHTMRAVRKKMRESGIIRVDRIDELVEQVIAHGLLGVADVDAADRALAAGD